MNSKNRFVLSTFFFALLVGVAYGRNVVVATSDNTLTNVPFWVGIEKRLFQQAGITIDYVLMRSDLAAKGLITGDVDYMQSVSSVMRAGAAGVSTVVLFGTFNRTFFELVARPEIRSLPDLKGKVIAISRYGASTEYAVRFGLKANGIDPDREVKLLAFGASAPRISALYKGLAAASVLQVPENFVAQKLGAHTILSLGQYLETLLSGVGASRRKVEENRDEVKRLLRGLVKSIVYMADHRSETVEIIQKRLAGIDRNVAEYIYALVTKHVTKDGIPSEKALRNTLLGTPFEGKVAGFEKLADFSIAREVADEK